MNKLSNDYKSFLNAIQEFEASYSNFEATISDDIDKSIELGLGVDNIASLAFTFHQSILKNLTEVHENNCWAWYHYSTFIRFNTVNHLKAFAAAKKSVEILRFDRDFIGAISRNFITLAFENKLYEEMAAELNYLLDNESSAARILEGIVADIERLSMREAIDEKILKILLQYSSIE